jgi:hypothetical protein
MAGRHSLHGRSNLPPTLCKAEKNALNDCTVTNTISETVTGARTTCSFASGTGGGCGIGCKLGEYYFSSQCSGPAGLPVRCSCSANYRSLDMYWGDYSFYANDCADAARRFADGEWCTNYLDCCFEFTDESGKHCACGPETSCAEHMQFYKGTRVEKCPQYDPSL